MPCFVVLTREQIELEQAADALLSGTEHDPEQPVYTERTLRRREPPLRVSVDRIAHLESIRGQSLRDELRFLAAVTPLTRVEKACFSEWVDGWSQREIAHRLRLPQQTVCRLLHSALTQCYDSTPLSFDAFCKRSIYRPPSHELRRFKRRVCKGCGEEFAARSRRGVFCSLECARAGGRA